MKISKRIAAGALALGLAFGGSMIMAPAAQAVRSGIGTGVVEIAGVYTSADDTRLGYPQGTASFGTGVVTPNQWGNNEVITNFHVLQGIPNDGSSIYIRIPGVRTAYKGYVQRWDVANDLAVLWIWGGPNGTSAWPTAAPQFQESAVSLSTPPNDMPVESCGDGYGDPFNYQTPLDCHFGTITNNWYSPAYYRRDYDGGLVTLYNVIKHSGQTVVGDSGGPMYICNPVCGIFVAGINASSDSAPGNQSYAIQMWWAVQDMLSARP